MISGHFPDFGKHRGDRAEAGQGLFNDRRDHRIVRVGPERDGQVDIIEKSRHGLLPSPVNPDRQLVRNNALVGERKEDLHANASPERADQVLDGIGYLPVPAHAHRRFHRERNAGWRAGGERPVAVVCNGHVNRFPLHP